ncbi:glycosyltransferase family 9 protein [bacterium]|nr:MAG: glycosyltransferase family 9 protein [bacterium]
MTERKILLIRLSSLGDTVLATSAVEALAAAFPGVKADILTKPGFTEVFAGNPAVGETIAWPENISAAGTAKLLAGKNYDFVVDLHANLRTRLLRLFLRGPRWSVYRKGAVRRRIALLLGTAKNLRESHVVDKYIAALAPLGVPAKRKLPRLYPGEDAPDAAAVTLCMLGWDGSSRIMALAPGARWPTKAWPEEKWTSLAKKASEGGFFILIVGGGEDEEPGKRILAASGAKGLVAAGKTAVLGTSALLGLSCVLVTNDSSPLHIATASGTPVVALFGPTVRNFGFFPLGERDEVVETSLECRPCSLHGARDCPRSHFRCMREITPEAVYEAALRAAKPEGEK